MSGDWEKYREKIIGLGESSARKSYYPELQEKIMELEASQANLQTIFDSTNDGIVIHDRLGKIIYLNKQAQRLFNISEEQTNLYTIFDISSKKMINNDLYDYWNSVLEGNPTVIEWLVSPIQKDIEILLQVSINRTNWFGKTVLVAVLRDFTERKKYEEELIEARRRAEDSDKLKSVFLANLSHEIRTPMNAILGFSELLKNNSLPADKRDNFIDIINKSGNHLLSIINDIVEISKIETNQVKLHTSVVRLNDLIDDLYEASKVMVPIENQVTIKAIKSIQYPDIEVVADEVKLRQVLINLISNSIKYTNDGIIEFGFSVGSYIEFFVTDTGIGIEKINQEIIFERFRRVEGDIAIQKGGSGLGLAISKAYVEMMGGSISLDSELGKGSTFKFMIPYIKPEKQKLASKSSCIAKPELSNGFDSTTILVVEDDDGNYKYLSEVLPVGKFHIMRAFNGKEAIEVITKDKDINLILMDIKMPVMNGFDALKIIRKMHPEIPVIAQTAYALPNDDVRIREAGFNGYITKPIVKDRLFSIIKQVLEGKNV